MFRVMIVEDDPMVARLNSKYLKMIEGFDLAGVVPNGEAALDFLKDTAVDLILLDVFMPRLGGVELLKIIKRDHVNVDVIMVTAAKCASDIQVVLRHGVIDYIVKPFEFERFQTALLAYQERCRLLYREESIEQHSLDREILYKKQNQRRGPLPKGIDLNTLSIIQQAIVKSEAKFTINDLCAIVGFSRISVKKYFDYMEEMDELRASLHYPAVGRPSRLYQATPELKKYMRCS